MKWLERLLGRGREPTPAPSRGDPVRVLEAQRVIDDIAALVAADGGWIELVAVEGGWVHVRLHGACAHCGSSELTLRQALEPRLRATLTWFEGLRAV